MYAEPSGHPGRGQTATLVGVRGEEALVAGATISEVTSDQIIAALEDPARMASPVVVPGRSLTILYADVSHVMRLRVSIESIDETAGTLILRPMGPARPSERREFVRAQVALEVVVQDLDAATASEALNAASALSEAGLPAEADWKRQKVDLSGSGVGIVSERAAHKGRFLVLSMRSPFLGRPIAGVLGEIVRCDELPDGRHELGVRFVEPSPSLRDKLMNLVFRVRYAQLGVIS